MVIQMKSSKFSSLSFATLGLAVFFANGCVQVEAEVPEVSVVQKDLGFEALPIQVTGEHSVPATEFTFPHGPIEFPEGFDSNLRTVGVQLITNRGIEDFSFIRRMNISMTDGRSPRVDLASFDRDEKIGSMSTEGNVLELKTLSADDTLKMWQTDAVTFTIELTGTLPHVAWSMDVAVHFSGDFAYEL